MVGFATRPGSCGAVAAGRPVVAILFESLVRDGARGARKPAPPPCGQAGPQAAAAAGWIETCYSIRQPHLL